MILIENPLLFARWLQVERGIIGEDVDIDGLFAQYYDDKGCYHDLPALVPAEGVWECECGALGLVDEED